MLSRRTSALIRLITAEMEAGRQSPVQCLHLLDCLVADAVVTCTKGAGAGDFNLDVIAFLQAKRLYDRGGQPDGQAVAPFSGPHRQLLIYIGYLYQAPTAGFNHKPDLNRVHFENRVSTACNQK